MYDLYQRYTYRVLQTLQMKLILLCVKDNFEAAALDKLLTKVAKTGTSLSVNFPKFSGDFRLSVGDSVLVVKRYNTSKCQV